MQRLRALGLLNDDGPLPTRLTEACFEERLLGGLSLSRRATPDEAFGPLTRVMGGAAASLRLADVRTDPCVLELTRGDSWQVDDVPALLERLNDAFFDVDGVKVLVLLGEWEGMLQVWALTPEVLEVLLSTRLLDGAPNVEGLRASFDDLS